MSEELEPDFSGVFEYLRSKVRQYGFAEFDLAIEQLIGDIGDSGQRFALQEYVKNFLQYLRVFEPESIQKTERLLNQHLGYQRWTWSLEETGPYDAEIFGAKSSFALEDMAAYSRVSELRARLVELARGMGLDIPDDGDDTPENPPRHKM